MFEQISKLRSISEFLRKSSKNVINDKDVLIDDLEKQIEKLKEFDDKETKFAVDFSNYGRASYDAFQWQKRLVAQYFFFARTLGIIDGYLDDVKKEIKFQSGFSNTQDTIEELMEKRKGLLRKRFDVVGDYKRATSFSELDVAIKCLETCPSYKTFERLYDDLSEHDYQMDLQLQLLNAYNSGYGLRQIISQEDYFDNYDRLYESLVDYKAKNSRKRTNVKTKFKV